MLCYIITDVIFQVNRPYIVDEYDSEQEEWEPEQEISSNADSECFIFFSFNFSCRRCN